MTTRAKLTVCSALACALATLCLTPLLVSDGWLFHAFALTALTAAVGACLRRLAVPRWLVPVGQLLVVLYALLLSFAGAAMTVGLLPGPKALSALATSVGDGVGDIQEYAIPAPASAGLRLILVGSVALIAVLVDAVAVTFRRAATAGLPLLALYSVGTGLGTDDGRAWLWFLLAALGYLLLLFAEGQDRLSRWGRVFHGGGRADGGGSGALSLGGHRIGLLALAVALVLPIFLGDRDHGLLDGPTGNGVGRGGGGVTTLDPLVTLSASLSRPTGRQLLTYTMSGDAAGQTYLRTAALDVFDGTEWRLGSKDVVGNPGTLPAPDGLTGAISTAPVTTAFTIGEGTNSVWLPMPYPATRATPPGRWNLERSTRTLVGDGKQTTQGLEYQVTSLDVRPTAAQLRAAAPTPDAVGSRYLDLPAGLPPVVAATAADVTRGRTTAYDRAVALQTWFTRTGGFQYDTEVPAGTGNEAIADFLRNKKGFCVHYASTMAAMARALGIPARVAVGFTPGSPTGAANSFSVTDREYHAWPELYFPGTGWLRFEPTPTRGTAPEYSEPVAAPSTAPSQQSTSAAPTAGAVPSATAGSSCKAGQQGPGCGDAAERKSAAAAGERPWLLSWQVLAGAVGVLVLLALLATPMLWRGRQRRRRLGAAGRRKAGREGGGGTLSDAEVLSAWEELVDTAWDLGIPPDDSRTPRSAVRRIAEAGELDDGAAAAAGRIALATERVLYAPGGGPAAAPLAPDVRAARDGLRASARRTGRARAVLLPPSSARLWWLTADRIEAVRAAVGGGLSRAAGAATGPVRRAWARTRPGRRG